MIVINIRGNLYDISGFVDEHPGGFEVLMQFAGTSVDAADDFDAVGHSDEALSLLDDLRVKTTEIDHEAVIVIDADFETKETSELLPAGKIERNSWLTIRPFVWFMMSSTIAALIVGTSAISGRSDSLFIDLTKAMPTSQELGLGRFPIRGYSVPFDYPFMLPETSTMALITSWTGYLLHQFGQYYLLFSAQRAKAQGEIIWTNAADDKINPFAWSMIKINSVFIGLHFIQTHLFYDGLAASVPEMTALGSVIMLLVVIYILEIPRRGLLFGTFPYKKSEWIKSFTRFTIKYHGYVASFGIVYDFWYHPMEATSGHVSGFLYMFLLFWQSSLLYQNEHRSRWWTLWLETFVCIHGLLTALFQETGTYQFLVFGFLTAFFITQLWGAPVVVRFLSLKPSGSQERSRLRYWTVLVLSVFGYLAVTLVTFYLTDNLSKFLVIFGVTGQLWLVILMYLASFTAAFLADKLLVERMKVLVSKSWTWWTLGIAWAVVANFAILNSFQFTFGGGKK